MLKLSSPGPAGLHGNKIVGSNPDRAITYKMHIAIRL